MQSAIQQLAEAIQRSPRVVVLTGSGISADSGVPTFRDPQEGLWAKFQPQDLATPDAFLHDPDFVWQWYQWRRKRVLSVEPNAGHRALARLAEVHPSLTLVTQNVDGLHQRAGHREVIEFHGNIHRNHCFDNGHEVRIKGHPEKPPRCPLCESLARPSVVWFGETIPEPALERAVGAARQADLFIAIGTSATVYPAAGLADLARGNGATIAEINPEATQMAALDISIRARAAQVLPALLEEG
ncbi:SIR2 family NAD-dependent protein deacylase [Natronospira bacteriovora]|uniref:NAD-dependent protein deacylase n=1 Tax=Natronospira bacteriovora TaxID=3069753 RepID=A0ABU0W9T4_9GAMM|nr:NAD-dependent deacylase [Natronospira sp. AB-CW4]MDQ2070664.1 NAD-dependent deacylase [Natronospira sp. AB-CW4]